jgi:hypothetical protein
LITDIYILGIKKMGSGNNSFNLKIFMPRKNIISGVPSIVSINENNNSNLVKERCTPYDVTIESNNLLGLLEIEDDELIPLTDYIISTVCIDIHN